MSRRAQTLRGWCGDRRVEKCVVASKPTIVMPFDPPAAKPSILRIHLVGTSHEVDDLEPDFTPEAILLPDDTILT